MTQRCLIVGAGISGLVAARVLIKQGWQVTILEKSSGYGGRMATRRIGESVFDHGAQFITVRSMFFRSLVEQWEDDGLIKQWCRGFLNADRQLIQDGYLRFYAAQGMNTLAKDLAHRLEPDLSKNLKVHLQEKITEISLLDTGWQLKSESGQAFNGEALIVTAPLPQSLQLLKQTCGFSLETNTLEQLETVKYDPCIAVMASLDGPSGLAEPGGLDNKDPMSPIKWIADNRQKGISNTDAVTILGTAHFSRKHWKMPREEAGELLWQAAKSYLKSERIEIQTHGWRYAQPKHNLEENYLCAHKNPALLLAGDAFGEDRNPIEGAAVSGLEAAQALLKL